jgi:hypothetical protein
MTSTVSSSVPSGRGMHIALSIVEIVLILFWGAVLIGIGGFSVAIVGLPALWGIGVLIILLLLILAGHEINGQWNGVLIDSRNKLSLSRLQITLWTVMVLSAYLSMAIPRIIVMNRTDDPLTQEQALNIRFPEQLILAMGISAVSFAGANLITSNKKSKQVKIEARFTPEAARDQLSQLKTKFVVADDNLKKLAQIEIDRKQELDAAAAGLEKAKSESEKELAEKKQFKAQELYKSAQQDKDAATLERDERKKEIQAAEENLALIDTSQGLLHKNADPSEAKWTDLFQGEEIGNYKMVDMAKVQMLFFTVVVVGTYAAAIVGMLYNTTSLLTEHNLSFPDFTPSLNALLGISHGTYLSVKTVDHS